jgi:SAM-dependent methyltransferase
MQDFFTGKVLYGDNFSTEEIQKWFQQEAEGYSSLVPSNLADYYYGYHQLNTIHGFNHLKHIPRFHRVLGLGSALGFEFEPILEKTDAITIVEPSDKLVSKKLGHLVPEYVKPSLDGSLQLDDNTFDLITCFGTLHHIPNVSYVVGELIRILQPNGHLLIREPIVSMGDWAKPRAGLTRNERGIPVAYFDGLFSKSPVSVVSKSYCFTLTSAIQKVLAPLNKKPFYRHSVYVQVDKVVSHLLRSNVRYHSQSFIHKFAPSSIFYVLKKHDF